MTLTEILKYNKKFCDVTWKEPNGRQGGMSGWVFVDKEGWLCTDYGYGILPKNIESIKEISPDNDRPFWEAHPEFFVDAFPKE